MQDLKVLDTKINGMKQLLTSLKLPGASCLIEVERDLRNINQWSYATVNVL